MPRQVFPPFTLPPQDIVSVSRWELRPSAPSVSVDADRLRGWDHTVDVTASVSVRVDHQALADACGLGPDSRFAAVLGWHASGSGLRGMAARGGTKPDDDTHLTGTLEGGRLGGRLRLTAAVVVVQASQPGPVAASRAGSILYREHRSWLLEGVGSRFPVEQLDFRSAGMRHPAAAWVVQWDRRDPEWDALSAVRLQLNSRHPLIEEMADPTRPGADLLHSVMRRDVLRELITTATELDGFVIDPVGWPEGSLGQALSIVLAALFPDACIEDVQALRREDPAGFEAVIQGGSDFLWGEKP